MKMAVEEKGATIEDYTKDGTVDLKGRQILRSRTGGWKGCCFMVGYEVLERIAYQGVASNLMIFFTDMLGYGTVAASNVVNNWVGTAWMLPIVGAYVADAHLGRYWTFIIGSCLYILGMGLLTVVVSVPSLMPICAPKTKAKKCPQDSVMFHDVCLFGALYIIAIGNGGTKPNISSMGADQFDDMEPMEKKQKMSFFNWWMFSVFLGSFLATTLMVNVQEKLGFAKGYGLQAVLIVLGLCLFLVGTPFYRHKKPAGSAAFSRIVQVLVAALRKWNVRIPDDPKELHELSFEGNARIYHTSTLRFLNKAAVKTGQPYDDSPWMLCTVTQVEETKQMMKMIPILLSTIIPSSFFAGVQTLFVKQGKSLNRNLIFPNYKIPPSSLKCLVQIFMLASVVPYDRLFVPYMRRITKNPRGITMLTRMGIGMALYVAIASSAYFAELKRRKVIRESGTYGADESIPISVFILLPQFALVGIADTFLEVAKMDFFYDQAPSCMKSLGTSYYFTSLGIGSFLNGIILRTVSNITKGNGNPGWVPDYNLNVGHLDYYYAFWILLTFLNFIFYLVVAKSYVYNQIDPPKSKNKADQTIHRRPDRDE